MSNFYRYLILIEIALMVANIFLCFYIFVVKRTIMLKYHGYRIILSLLIFALLASIFVAHITMIFHPVSQYFVSILLLCGELAFSLTLYSFVNQLAEFDEHGIEILETVIGVIEAEDPNLEGHSLHVHNLVLMLYENLPLRYRIRVNLNKLEYAALLLDLGKFGIPREIINKSGKLTKNEKELIQKHPEFGARIVKQIDFFDEISEWIKYQHERVDGSGYYHLKGDEIPIESRILAVADTFSALTMERSYRASLNYEQAIAELKIVSGTQLDGEIVKYFCMIPLRKIEHSECYVKSKMTNLAIDAFINE